MKISFLAPVVVTLLVLVPLRSEAQQLNLQIKDGLVSLDAQNVSVRQILAEWSRVGGAKIVNGEKVTGAAVTLQLSGVPERQAIDTILRGVGGYMLASRNADSTGISAFDRILILPTSAAPRPGGGPAPAAVAGYPGPRSMPVQAEPAEEIVEDTDSDEPPAEDDPGEEEVVQQQEPPQGMNPRFRRGFPGQPPFNVPQQTYPGAAVNGPDGQTPPGAAPSPANPFGVPAGAGTVPGVATPVPQQQDPNQPQSTRPRPPV